MIHSHNINYSTIRRDKLLLYTSKWKVFEEMSIAQEVRVTKKILDVYIDDSTKQKYLLKTNTLINEVNLLSLRKKGWEKDPKRYKEWWWGEKKKKILEH